MVVKKKTVKVEALDLEEEKLQMLIGNITDVPLSYQILQWFYIRF